MFLFCCIRCAKFAGNMSSLREVTGGVPQGLVLELVLFWLIQSYGFMGMYSLLIENLEDWLESCYDPLFFVATQILWCLCLYLILDQL